MIEYLFPFALRRRAELSGEANNRTSSPLRCKTGNPIDSRISNDTRDPLMPDAIDLALSAKRFRAWPWFRNRPSKRRFGSLKIKDSASWKLFLPTDEISRFSRRRIHILWIREIYARKFSAMKSVPAAHVSEPTRANCTNLRLFTSAGIGVCRKATTRGIQHHRHPMNYAFRGMLSTLLPFFSLSLDHNQQEKTQQTPAQLSLRDTTKSFYKGTPKKFETLYIYLFI